MLELSSPIQASNRSPRMYKRLALITLVPQKSTKALFKSGLLSERCKSEIKRISFFDIVSII